MFLGICSEEIKVIINTCEASVVDNPKEEPIYIVPKKETIVRPTKLPVCIESKKETHIIVPKKDPVCKSSKKAPIHKAPENTNKLYLKITSRTIEKLREQIGSDVIRYLEIRVLSSNTSNIKSLKKKLKAHGADEEEINVIINNCEVVKPVLPVKKGKIKMITIKNNVDSKKVIDYQNNSTIDTQKINYLIKKGNIMSDKLCNYKEAIQCYNQAFRINKSKELDKKLIDLKKKCEDKIEKQKLLKKSNELKKNSSPIFLNKAINLD
jgi:tetratricopeptide (TPR) repeat protein